MKFLLILLLPFPLYARTIKVAVIDTGYDVKKYSFPICKDSVMDYTGKGIHDSNGHGNNVSHLIHEMAGEADYCQIPIKFYAPGVDTAFTFYKSLLYASRVSDVVNISVVGSGRIKKEVIIIKKMLDKGIVILTAAGNDAINLDKSCTYYPACYDSRIVVVGDESIYSNFGKVVDIKIDGRNRTAGGVTLSGTSQSTAAATGLFLKHYFNNFHKREINSKSEKALKNIAKALYKDSKVEKNISDKLKHYDFGSLEYVFPAAKIFINKKIEYKWEF